MIEMVDVGGKMKNMETRLTNLVKPKIENTTKTTNKKVERRSAAVVAPEKFTGRMQGKVEH